MVLEHSDQALTDFLLKACSTARRLNSVCAQLVGAHWELNVASCWGLGATILSQTGIARYSLPAGGHLDNRAPMEATEQTYAMHRDRAGFAGHQLDEEWQM